MEFTCQSEYNGKSMAVMAKALRKTVRKKKSQRSHIFGWTVVGLGILMCMFDLSENGEISFRIVITGIAVLVILLTLLMEDKINGYVARKRILPGTERAETVFSEDGFCTTTQVGKTQWKYDKIQSAAESKEYFVFVFSTSHGQIYEKKHIQGGTLQEFRDFLEKKIGKPVQIIP